MLGEAQAIFVRNGYYGGGLPGGLFECLLREKALFSLG